MKGIPLVFEEGGKGVGIILGDITSIKDTSIPSRNRLMKGHLKLSRQKILLKT